MRVFVKWMEGGNDAGTVDIALADSLATVRDAVAEATGVHASLQSLIFGGVKLEDVADMVEPNGDPGHVPRHPRLRQVIVGRDPHTPLCWFWLWG